MSQPKEHYIADVTEIPVGGRLLVTVEGREIGVFNLNGNFYALRNYCFHQGGPLCEGKITGTLTATKETAAQRQRTSAQSPSTTTSPPSTS